MIIEKPCLSLTIGLSLGAAVLSFNASLSMAGTATIQSGDGPSTVFEYNETMLRIGTNNENSYAVVRDGSMYAVVSENGTTMVIDAGSMMKNFASVAPQAMQTEISGKIIKLEKTGKTETIAGIKGDVYELQFEDENGETQNADMVLSGDKRAKEFRDALFLMMGVATQMASEDAAKAADDMQKRLQKMDLGVLRYGTEMTVSTLDSKTIDTARFELPAAPLNLDGLGAMLGGMTQESNDNSDAGNGGDNATGGGLFSSMMGALGNQADRQADRADDSVEQEINKETDEQVDNAIGKAFGKLFGR